MSVTSRRSLFALTGVLATAGGGMAFSGCTNGSSDGATGNTGYTGAATGDAASYTDGVPGLRVSRDDLVSPSPVAWESWELIHLDIIELTYTAGPITCQGVHAEVIETERDVTINLSVGNLPDAEYCTEVAEEARCRVQLSGSLDRREIRQDSS